MYAYVCMYNSQRFSDVHATNIVSWGGCIVVNVGIQSIYSNPMQCAWVPILTWTLERKKTSVQVSDASRMVPCLLVLVTLPTEVEGPYTWTFKGVFNGDLSSGLGLPLVTPT